MKNFLIGVAMTIIVTLAGGGLFYYLKAPSLSSMGYLSLSDFTRASSSIASGYNHIAEEVAAVLPTLKDMGYEDSTFCIRVGLLPKAKVRLRSSKIPESSKVAAPAGPDPSKVAAPAGPDPHLIFATTIFAAATEAKKIQSLAKLDTVVIDADFSVPPSLRTYFLNGKAGMEGTAGLEGTAEKGAKTKQSITESDLICGP